MSDRHSQRGVMLLEALLAILIFSMGILAIVGLQATSVKLSNDAKYRSDASLLANQLIGLMWVGNRTSTTLQANFSSPSGANYQSWLNDVQAGLPGSDANPPIVSIVPVVGPNGTSSQVTITIFWKLPSESTSSAPHQYVAMAQIF